jgi:alkanesulfonate monooxygenase SsuD/methylene tetrahydromethanopterin reductase-like flavin-dependent oxidoreductase (luciferase family)
MEGRFLDGATAAELDASAQQAAAGGIDVVLLSAGPLGDPITLAAALSATTTDLLLGVRTSLAEEPHRHPTVLARDMTALDLVSGGRSVLAFAPPFGPELGEAIELCRDMWRNGIAASDGPYYPVAGAINRPRPDEDGGPLLALDLTDRAAVHFHGPFDAELLAPLDLVLVADADHLTVELPEGVVVCVMR